MKFSKYYSSSRGNLYTVTAGNGKRLLLECGVTERQWKKSVGYCLTDIESCLLTHEHKDHSKGIMSVMRAGKDVYASRGTWGAIGGGEEQHWHRAKVAADLQMIDLPSFQILPFSVEHDSPEPLGFIIREKENGKYMFFATDASVIKSAFPYEFSIVAISCSFDRETVKRRVEDGTIVWVLGERLLNSHFEREQCRQYLMDSCDLSRCEAIYLLHCSVGNLDKEAARKSIEKSTLVKTIA